MPRAEKGEVKGDGRNVVSSQLTSHLTAVWKVKISLDVYSKSYKTSTGGISYPESRKEKQRGLYRCAIDFQLTLISFPVCLVARLHPAPVALSQITGILVVKQKKVCRMYIVFQVRCNILLCFYTFLEKTSPFEKKCRIIDYF